MLHLEIGGKGKKKRNLGVWFREDMLEDALWGSSKGELLFARAS